MECTKGQRILSAPAVEKHLHERLQDLERLGQIIVRETVILVN